MSAEFPRSTAFRRSTISFKVRIGAVTFGNYLWLPWPLNMERGIVPANSARRLWVVKLRHLIEHFGLILKSEESMCAPLRNIQHVPVGRRQDHGDPAPERRGFRPAAGGG